ncbi:16S rRNA (guanine(527)-N(7))-methyltransferase RsmG [Lichenicoccus sp.]|uniref:16S rRNA (guanine(527)-N(7))-methyltransferase RsmG n=1 Tax=Lichenicoccus sp. TaxID=2781899 RepID=UPI003D0FD509
MIESFVDTLLKWNQRINLVATGDVPHLWTRHVADSLQLGPLLPPGLPFTDLGSGAGFPGLVLSIAFGNPVTMIESDTRKASFLREAARVSQANARIINSRIEDADVVPAPVITARALAALPTLLYYAFPLLQPSGFCLFLKGRKVVDELAQARSNWHFVAECIPSQTDPAGTVLKLSQIRRLNQS